MINPFSALWNIFSGGGDKATYSPYGNWLDKEMDRQIEAIKDVEEDDSAIKSNANLIAAAPGLLEAAIELQLNLTGEDTNQSEFNIAIANLFQAIAKAKGESD